MWALEVNASPQSHGSERLPWSARLREEQMLTFQALLFILFPHPFHKRQKLQDRNFNSHKKLRQQLEASTKQPKLRRPPTSSRTIDKHRTRWNSDTYRSPTQNIKACALIEGYLFSSHSQTMLTSVRAVTVSPSYRRAPTRRRTERSRSYSGSLGRGPGLSGYRSWKRSMTSKPLTSVAGSHFGWS
jgi:hypothetical protein